MDRYAGLRATHVAALVCSLACVAGEGLTLHPASAMVRIGGADGSLPPAAETYAVELARGEREGFQFAVLPAGPAPVKVTRVSVTGAPGAPASLLFAVLPVKHAAPPTEGQFIVPPRALGWIPDVLLALEDHAFEARAVPPSNGAPPLTYYVEFAADPEAVPGEYKLQVAVESEMGSRALAVTLSVRVPTIPVRLPFRSAICWNWSLEKYAGRPLEAEEKRRFWELCLRHRLSPCAFFDKAPDPAPEDLAPLVAQGLSFVSLMQVSGQNPKPLGERRKEELAPRLKRWRAELERQGLLADAFVLLADEPPAGCEAVCGANAAWLKAQFPELKILVATRPTQEWAAFTDAFDVVTAHSSDLYARHSHDDEAYAWWRRERPFPKGEYWWFHSVEPYAPHANLRLDNAPLEARVSGWQCAAAGVDGYEYFWLADWSANSEGKDQSWPARAETWKTGLSGAGTLCYPDEHGRPLPSLRLVNLRDGLEDWALLEQAAARADSPARRALTAPVTRGLTDFTREPAVLLEARHALLEKLSEPPKK